MEQRSRVGRRGRRGGAGRGVPDRRLGQGEEVWRQLGKSLVGG